MFSKVNILFYILIGSVGAFQFLYNLINIWYGQSVLDILIGYFIKVLTCLSLMMYEVQYFFMCLFTIYMLFWVKYLIFLPNYYFFLIVEILKLFLLYSGHKSFIRYMICKCFLSVCGLSFCFS